MKEISIKSNKTVAFWILLDCVKAKNNFLHKNTAFTKSQIIYMFVLFLDQDCHNNRLYLVSPKDLNC